MRLQLWKAKIADLEESMKLHFESSLNDTSTTLKEADQVFVNLNMEVAIPLPSEGNPVVQITWNSVGSKPSAAEEVARMYDMKECPSGSETPIQHIMNEKVIGGEKATELENIIEEYSTTRIRHCDLFEGIHFIENICDIPFGISISSPVPEQGVKSRFMFPL